MKPVQLEVRSSDQWFTVMDRMLKLAMDDIIERTTVAEYCVSRLVVFQHDNKRRGLSMRMGRKEWDWVDVVSAMLRFLAAPSLSSFLEIRIDRAYVHEIIREFLKAVDGYTDLMDAAANDPVTRMTTWQRLDRVHTAIGMKGGRDILQTISNVSYLNQEITLFRNLIIQVYTEYIEKTAAYDAANHPLRVSPKDTRQNYYLAAIKAINHFNQDRGSFKSYLDIWLKKARNTSGHVTGSAYTPPSGVQANHIAVTLDLDKIQETAADDPVDSVGEIVDLVNIVDPDGYLMDAMGLAESA